MNFEDKTMGFCSLCMQNVEHTRVFSFTITRFIDLLSLGLFRTLRIGPYYCFQCESKCYYLKPIRRDAPTFDSETMTARFRRRGEKANLGANQDNDSPNPQGVSSQILMVEPLGNLHKHEHSLVMQERRTQNFSANFRDSIVDRILQGEMSLAAAKNELNLTDSDLIRWIADLHHRKLSELETLRQALTASEAELPPAIIDLMNQHALFETGELEGAVIDRKGPQP